MHGSKGVHSLLEVHAYTLIIEFEGVGVGIVQYTSVCDLNSEDTRTHTL